MKYKSLLATIVFITSCVGFAQTNSQPLDTPEQFSATAFATSGAANGKSVGVNIFVNSYTTNDEVQQFLDTLKAQGQDGLEKAFDKAPERGRIAVTGSTGNTIAFIRSRNAETKRILRMATNRIIGFNELVQSPRSRDYKFTIIELRLDADGTGDGTLMYATKLKFNKKGELELEHFGQSPIRLANVRKQK